MRLEITVGLLVSIAACNRGNDPTSPPAESGAATEDSGPASATSTPGSTDAADAPADDSAGADGVVPGEGADVVEVAVTGGSGEFSFAVTLRSPDTGCDQYADWWEVLSSDGGLLYRRILAHSHVDEQPFTRSGGPVAIDGSTPVFVRAHMHPGGYGGIVMEGTAEGGFTALAEGASVPSSNAETEPPLPDGCAF